MSANDTREKLTDKLTKKLVDKYRESMKIRNLADKTITGNIRYLNKFSEYLEKIHGITEIDKVTKDTIYEYQIYQYERINKEITQRSLDPIRGKKDTPCS